MSPGARRAAGGAAALAVGVAAGLLWLSRGDDEEPAGRVTATASAISATTRVEPAIQAFGEPIVLETVVLTDPRVIDPATVAVDADVVPYEPAGRETKQVDASDTVARIVFRQPIVCLGEACAPPESGLVELPAATLRFRYRGDAQPAVRELQWPTFAVAERVGDADLQARRWQADPAELPTASYRIDPATLAAVLGAAALALLAAAAALAWAVLGRRAHEDVEAVRDTRPALERALDAATLACRDGVVSERRKALERVATELVRLGRGDLAEEARALAWSPRRPSLQAIEQLAGSARAALREAA